MKPLEFPPPRQPGIMIHVILIAVLTATSAAGAILAVQTEINLAFSLYIILAALAFFPLPFLAYRLFALLRGNYRLDRDKFIIVWGLRVEHIPISDVEWVRPAKDLVVPLHLPVLRLPGSLVGVRRHPDYGSVEFLASDARTLLLIGTKERVFAVSPEDAAEFVQNFQRAIEMGSLEPSQAASIYPSFVIGDAWQDLRVRFLWLAGLFINVGLLAWVSLLIPSISEVIPGFRITGEPFPATAGIRLIMFPIESIFFFVLGWGVGLVFYRRPATRPLAMIVWGTGLVASILFLLAVMFLITTPVP
ncbi:MAG: PH domain-containing protein [Chloroflexota bacterium]